MIITVAAAGRAADAAWVKQSRQHPLSLVIATRPGLLHNYGHVGEIVLDHVGSLSEGAGGAVGGPAGAALATPLGRRRKRTGRRHKPKKLAADKGYRVQRIRDWLARRLIDPVIPHKDNEHARHDPTVTFDREAYRNRCVAEQCVGWLKENRRIGTRILQTAVLRQSLAPIPP